MSDAHFTGLGVAEFVALAMHEGRPGSAVTLAQLGIADPALTARAVHAYGRTTLLARALLRMSDATSIEPAGIGRLVAHAAANADAWLTVALLGLDAPVDGFVVVRAPAGAMIVVRRALLSFQVAAADLRHGLGGLVWEALDRHFEIEPRGGVVVEAQHLRGDGRVERRRPLTIRQSVEPGDGGGDLYDVVAGHDLTEPGEPIGDRLTDEELDDVLSAELDLDDEPLATHPGVGA